MENNQKSFYQALVDGDNEIVLSRHENGQAERVVLVKDHKFHCDDGPAYRGYTSEGLLIKEIYMIDGKVHREDGAAEIDYDETGAIVSQKYYIKNQEIEELEYYFTENKSNLVK